MFRAIILLFFLSQINWSFGQIVGCNDPQAINYKPSATLNDGSCRYKKANRQPDEVCKLSSELAEISGMIYSQNSFWVLNDGGNSNQIFKLNSETFQIEHRVSINNFKNKDWEELAQNDQYIFIGDIGNNNGSREGLKILMVDKSKLNDTSVEAEAIQFNYPDQKDFSKRKQAHNYDGEAFFCYQDTIHLFSKNWINQWTKHYIIPAKKGIYTAVLKDSFDAGMLVTGADISPNGKHITLCGYDKVGNCGLWILSDFPEFNPFKGNKRYISLGSAINLGQMESIAYVDSFSIYLGSESFKNIASQQLNFFSLRDYLNHTKTSYMNKGWLEEFKATANNQSGKVNVEIIMKKENSVKLYIIDFNGKHIYTNKNKLLKPGYNQVILETGKLPTGEYLLVAESTELLGEYSFTINP